MKLKSLILGSVAAAGLSTAGFAADLGVLTSLDVCDELGLSGLTISSDTNCLQISGGVSYEFVWGNFRTEDAVARTFDGSRNQMVEDGEEDWNSKVEAWLRFVGTASSDFGPAKAVITLKEIDFTRVRNDSDATPYATDSDGEQDYTFIDEAYVSVGDTTVIMAGKKGSIAELGDDNPFNVLGLFTSDAIDGKGVGVDGDYGGLGGHVIQVQSDLGNGINIGVGLENLNGNSTLADIADDNDAFIEGDEPATHGTLVGVVGYAGENITAHLTGMAFGILDGDVESYAIHAGATGTFDMFKIRGALAYWDNVKYSAQNPGERKGIVGEQNVLNGLLSVEGTFDLFKLALSGEFADVSGVADYTDYGLGGSVGVGITEGVQINLAARYFYDDLYDLDTTQVAVQVVAALTETIKATGEIGAFFGDGVTTTVPGGVQDDIAGIDDTLVYGAAELAWTPGGGFSSSLRGEVNSEEAYKVTFKAAKSFE